MTAQTLSEWLAAIGLLQYAELLERNEISFEVLPDLSESDLAQIGLPLGARKRLRKAAARLGVTGPTSAPAVRSSQPERRQLTVMFCDLVGSTALSQALDPEQLREVMHHYQKGCRAVIEKYDGHLAQFLGDGLMVYFGWPRAHEDDAERGIRAGLEIIAKLPAMTVGMQPLHVRIGIATGTVVVGADPVESGSDLAVGETPNIAARLQGLAGTDEIVISRSTRTLLGSAFDLEDLGDQTLKGVLNPVQAWRVTGLGASDARFEATRGPAALTPLIGRQTEMSVLLDRWRRCEQGEGQVVLLSGEAGIGKSRCLHALREHIQPAGHARLSLQCSPFHVGTPLHPFIFALERACDFSRLDASEQRLDKLEGALLHNGRCSREEVALLAELMSLPVHRYGHLQYSPQERKDRTIALLLRHVLGMASDSPLLLTIEDLHWADPTTLETIELLVSRLEAVRILVVATHRPEFTASWARQSAVIAMSISRLSKREAWEVVQRLAGGQSLPPDVVQQIVARTDGIPLYVEEVTKAVLASSTPNDMLGRTESNDPLTALPTTLQGSLMSRLDRTPALREVAQAAACIGRAFEYGLLAEVVEMPASTLQQALDRLVDAQVLLGRTRDKGTYMFKHALLRDAAYDSMLKARRQGLHGCIARALERRGGDMLEAEPELLAMHYEQAGVVSSAIAWYTRAGEVAKSRSANREAIRSFERALALLRTAGDSGSSASSELDIHLNLGMLYTSLENFTSQAGRDHFIQAERVSATGSDPARRARVLIGLINVLIWQARSAEATRMADQLVEPTYSTGERVHRLFSLEARARTYMYAGRFAEALEEAQRALTELRPDTDRGLAFEYGYDPAVYILMIVAYVHRELGYLDAAAEALDRCVSLARISGHPYSLAFALATPGADLWYLMAEPERALIFAKEGSEVAGRGGFLWQKFICELHWGWAVAKRGGYVEGLKRMTDALDGIKSLGVLSIIGPRMTAQLASVYGMAGRADEGLELLAASPDRAPGRKRVRYAEIFRIEGDLHLQKFRPDPGKAEELYQEAIHIALEDSAKAYELRASISLAKLWRTQDKRREAYELLAPIYAWFTEGFGYPDLREAKLLLDELKLHYQGESV